MESGFGDYNLIMCQKHVIQLFFNCFKFKMSLKMSNKMAAKMQNFPPKWVNCDIQKVLIDFLSPWLLAMKGDFVIANGVCLCVCVYVCVYVCVFRFG